MQKFTKKIKFSASKYVKVAGFGPRKSLKLISRKIWVIGNYWNFHTTVLIKEKYLRTLGAAFSKFQSMFNFYLNWMHFAIVREEGGRMQTLRVPLKILLAFLAIILCERFGEMKWHVFGTKLPNDLWLKKAPIIMKLLKYANCTFLIKTTDLSSLIGNFDCGYSMYRVEI